MVAVAAQALLTEPGQRRLLVNTDITAAFQMIIRDHVLTSAYQCDALRGAWRMIDWTYGRDPSPLWLQDAQRKIIARLSSSQGVRQGCVCSQKLFCVANMAPLRAVKEAYPDTIVHAYSDDAHLYFSASALHVPAAVDLFIAESKKIGCQVNLGKSKAVVLDDEPLPAATADWLTGTHIRVERSAVKLVGAPVGRDKEAMRKIALDCARKHDELFRLLVHAEMPAQEALLLLRVCGVPRFGYMLRVSDEETHRDGAALFDEQTSKAVLAILQLDQADVSDTTLALIEQPLKLGGLAIRRQAFVSPFAAVASHAQAARLLKKCLAGGEFHPASPQCKSLASALDVIQEATKGKAAENKLVPKDLKKFNSFYEKEDRLVQAKLQKTLTAQAEQVKEEGIRAKLTPAQMAMHLSASGTLSSAALTAIPDSPDLVIAPLPFVIYCRLRVCAQPLNNSISKCACGASFVQDPAHSLNCNKLKGRNVTKRHDSAVQVYAGWVRAAGGACTVEKRVGSWPSQKRYDAVAIMGNFHAASDFVITNAAAPSHVVRAQAQGKAAKKAAADKRREYSKFAAEDRCHFVPMSIEAMGHWDSAAVDHVRHVANFAVDSGECVYSRYEVHRGLVCGISVAVARGVGSIILQGQRVSVASADAMAPQHLRDL